MTSMLPICGTLALVAACLLKPTEAMTAPKGMERQYQTTKVEDIQRVKKELDDKIKAEVMMEFLNDLGDDKDGDQRKYKTTKVDDIIADKELDNKDKIKEMLNMLGDDDEDQKVVRTEGLLEAAQGVDFDSDEAEAAFMAKWANIYAKEEEAAFIAERSSDVSGLKETVKNLSTDQKETILYFLKELLPTARWFLALMASPAKIIDGVFMS